MSLQSIDSDQKEKILIFTSGKGGPLNAVFKRWLEWKELALDTLAHMFYLVTGFYVNEIRRGFCGVGK